MWKILVFSGVAAGGIYFALRAVSEANARASAAEERLSHYEKTKNSELSTDDMAQWKEEIEKLRVEAQSCKDHMLQYRSLEAALKQMEDSHENFKAEAEKVKKSLEDEVASLKEHVNQLQDGYNLQQANESQDDRIKVLEQGSDREFDKKSTALDQHISMNDHVRILEGPLEDKKGILKQGVDENQSENCGYFCAKAQICEKMESSADLGKGKGGKSDASGFDDFPSSPKSPLSPQKPFEDKEDSRNFDRDDTDDCLESVSNFKFKFNAGESDGKKRFDESLAHQLLKEVDKLKIGDSGNVGSVKSRVMNPFSGNVKMDLHNEMDKMNLGKTDGKAFVFVFGKSKEDLISDKMGELKFGGGRVDKEKMFVFGSNRKTGNGFAERSDGVNSEKRFNNVEVKDDLISNRMRELKVGGAGENSVFGQNVELEQQKVNKSASSSSQHQPFGNVSFTSRPEKNVGFTFSSKVDNVGAANFEFKMPDNKGDLFSGVKSIPEPRLKKKKGKVRKPVISQARPKEDFLFGQRSSPEVPESFEAYSPMIPLTDTIGELLSLKAAGNEAYKAGKFTDAVNKYTSAIACSIESRPFAAICFCNRAAAYRALGQITDAIADCSLAISLDPSYLKAVSRRASLYEMIRDYGQAAIDLRKSVSIMMSQMEEKGILSGVSDISSGMNELRQTQLRLYNIEKESRKGIPLNMYLILGVESTSAESEVKKAYRKAALKHHPDKAALSVSRCDNGDDGVWKEIAENVHKDADRLFKMIGEAYDVLSNPSKRSEYDIDEDMRNKVNKFTRSSSGRMAADVQSPVFERSGSRQWQIFFRPFVD